MKKTVGIGHQDFAKIRQENLAVWETMLKEKGIPKEKIRSYVFAFCGKQVLIDRG